MSQSLSVEFLILSVSVGKYVDVCTHTKRHLIYMPTKKSGVLHCSGGLTCSTSQLSMTGSFSLHGDLIVSLILSRFGQTRLLDD